MEPVGAAAFAAGTVAALWAALEVIAVPWSKVSVKRLHAPGQKYSTIGC